MSCRTDGSRCATCGDVADRATVLAVDGPDAEVAFEDGGRATVAVDLVPGAAPGDVLLVHQGVAIGAVRAAVREADDETRPAAGRQPEMTR